MKTILVPTDFSPAANSAMRYAAQLALRTRAKLILYHSFMIPTAVANIPTGALAMDELEQHSMHLLKTAERKLIRKYGTGLNIVRKCGGGPAVDLILEAAEKHKADLIVMGLQGKSFLVGKLLGSITTAVIRKSGVPVLSVGLYMRFREPKKLVFASDERLVSPLVFRPVAEFASLFDSHVYLLNVALYPEEFLEAPHKLPAYSKLHAPLDKLDHSFHYEQGEDIPQAVNHFVRKTKSDLLIMVPHRHSFLGRLLNEPVTRQMAFKTKVPFLTLPDRH